MASPVVTAEMDRREKLVVSVPPAAKETQATEALMVTLETLVSVVLLELQETRETLVARAELAHLERAETLDQRVRGEVLVLPASLDRKETLELLDKLDPEGSQEEEGTMDQRAVRGQRELKVIRVRWDQRV